MELDERLYFWRTRKNISIYKLSKMSGISENHIRNLETGKKQPTIKTLQALTDCMGLTLSEFFNTDNSNMIYLSDGEKKLLELYRSLPSDKADILVEFYQRMCEE